MRRTVLSLLAVLAFTSLGLAAVSLGDWGGIPSTPGIDATGGPDLYGYTWKDSAEPGVVYNWKDISATGTLVDGLGDDNYVGPFPVGFTFKYYWYDITQYWIGSNGYLKFGTAYNMAQPFPPAIPSTVLPNDYVAMYVADWYPGEPVGTGRCYRWNNADSLVVSFINLHPWVGPGVTDGPHTFQVILSRLDSSISFQYGAQSGTVSNSDIIIGIENVSGQVGLEHSHDTYPASNYKVYYDYPGSTSYVAHDMATLAAANVNSEGVSILNGTVVTPYVKVKNVGNQLESTFTVNCTIQQVGGAVVYNQTVTRGPLAAGAELEVTFTPNWTPTTNATYFYRGTVTLIGDMNPNNNLKVAEAQVMAVPGTMYWDDGVGEQAWSWQGGNGGLGQHFVPPVYPAKIDSIRYFIAGTGTSPFTAQILDDNGPGGLPGTVLFSQNVSTPTAGQWYGVNTSGQNILINNGGFYLSWQMVDSLTAPLGTDSTANQPKSRQGWEYTGVWANYRNIEVADIMIRCRISQPGGQPAINVTLTPVGLPIVIPPGGGSFNFNAAVANTTTSPQTFDVWGMLRLPSGNLYGPVLGPVLNLTLPASAGLNRDRTQNIPGNAPAGSYKYIAAAGDYVAWQSWTITDQDSFAFSKTAVDLNSPFQSWLGYGESFENALTVAPEEYNLSVTAYPNPFNPTTTLSFTLPEAATVNLSVYNLSGRLVATLANGWHTQGLHQVTLDGANLASGVYLCNLNMGTHNTISKIVLMK